MLAFIVEQMIAHDGVNLDFSEESSLGFDDAEQKDSD